MDIVCLDLEGVLVPEIWIAFAEETGIPELKRTTRDEPDYNKLMNYRLNILREHGLGLKEIQETISKIDPLPGAREFLDKLKEITQVIIISDTFSQFAGPLMKKLWLSAKMVRLPILRCAVRNPNIQPSKHSSPAASRRSPAATATTTSP